MKKKLLIAFILILFAQGMGFAQTEDAEYWRNQGIQFYSQGNYTRAIECFLTAKNIYERTSGKDHPDYATSLSNLGLLYTSTGDYAQAERYLLESLGIYQRVLGTGTSEYAVLANNLGELYRIMGNYISAERYCLEALGIMERLVGKNHPDYATFANNVGLLYWNMGDYARAQQYYLEALGIRERVLGNSSPLYALSLNSLGALYDSMGDYVRAEKFLLEAVGIYERSLGKENYYYAVSLNSLSGLYYNMGDYRRAERYYLEALGIMERLLGKNHPDYATVLNNIALLYWKMENYSQSERYYLEALGIIERLTGKDHPTYTTFLNNLGLLYWAMGDYTRAQRYYLESLGIIERVLGKDHPYYAQSLNNIGLLYDKMRDYARAERYYLEALGIKERILGKGHPDYALSLNNLSFTYLSSKAYSRALEIKIEALQISADQLNRNFAFMSEQQREAYWSANSINTFEAIYSLSLHHPVPQSNILSYNNALFTKGLLLRTTNAIRDSIYSSGNQTLIAQYEDLGRIRQQISALQQDVEKQDYVRTLEQQADTLEKSLVQSSAAFRNFQTDLALNWQNVRNSLRADEAAIEFVSFRVYDEGWTNTTRYAALVLRPGMATPAWIPLCEEENLTRIFQEAAGERINEQTRIIYDEHGEELYKLIWQPLEKTLRNAKTVYYSPSGLLHKVSFNALPVNSSTRLMDAYTLRLVSSTREVVSGRNAAARAPNSAVVYGGITYTTNDTSMREAARGYQTQTASGAQTATRALSRRPADSPAWAFLAGTVSESDFIQGLLAQSRITSVLYNGNGGNEESFKALSGRRIAVIHLATHGFFIEDVESNYQERERLERLGGGQRAVENPLFRSGLIMAGANNAWSDRPVAGVEDGILFSEEIAKLNLLGAGVVVLSACETGLGTVNNSEGVFGLQRAFKLAGAETLIMSLWSVSDEATSIMMREFYRNWLSGKTKHEAFAQAQRTLRADSRFASPFYWAAFVMID